MNFEKLVEHLYYDVEYGQSVFDEKVAEALMFKINYDASYIIRDCVILCEEEGNGFYENLILECSNLVDDLENFKGDDYHFYYLLDTLRNKVEEIMNLLSSNHDDFSVELSNTLWKIHSLCDFY